MTLPLTMFLIIRSGVGFADRVEFDAVEEDVGFALHPNDVARNMQAAFFEQTQLSMDPLSQLENLRAGETGAHRGEIDQAADAGDKSAFLIVEFKDRVALGARSSAVFFMRNHHSEHASENTPFQGANRFPIRR